MNIGQTVAHVYNKKSSGKIVSVTDTKIQVQWDTGLCYLHAPKFLVDPDAGDEPLSSADFATVDAIEAIEPESLSDCGELDAQEVEAHETTTNETIADEEAVSV